jgi:nucleotide-binding universal stress UspA family protein
MIQSPKSTGEPMFEHVMVALDLSPAADAMLRCLPGLRELGTRRLTLVHVAQVDYPVFGAIAHLDHHRKRLEELATALTGKGFQVQVVAAAGNAAGEVLKAAEERDASLVLVGSRSHSRVREAFIGSVARDVVSRARIPVLLQRLEPVTAQAGAPLVASCCDLRSHVVHPTDFSAAAERAFAFVDALAHLGAHSFTLVHVRKADEEGGNDVDRDRLEAMAEGLRAAGVESVAVETLAGDPAEQVLRLAEQLSDPMIVMGTRGRGLVAEAVLGSVSREVVRRARGSVLLVPAHS